MAKRKTSSTAISPDIFRRGKESLRRKYRKSVFFNQKELEAIDEYCRKFGCKSRSGLIRQAVMEKVLQVLEESQPTLF